LFCGQLGSESRFWSLSSCDSLGDGDSATAKIRIEQKVKAVTTKLDILDVESTCLDELKVHGEVKVACLANPFAVVG
jgi:hypothetical protein